jgi:cytoskeleton-associated protein 5
MSEDLGSANAPVRSQAMSVLGICHSQVGEGPFVSLMDTLKPAQVTLMKEAFAKKPLNPSYQPTKSTKKIELAEEEPISQVEEDESVCEDEFVAEDIIERADINRFLNEGLVTRLTSSNWKERNAAVEEVENLLKESKHITDDLPQDFLTALKARFGDTNRNLAARALLLVGMLATAVGPSFDKLAHATLLTAALLNLSDNKKQVRDAAICMLDSWAKTCPAEKLFPALAEAAANPKGSAEGRVASLSWMLKYFDKNSRKCQEFASKAVKTASNDKSGAVRDAGAKLGALLDYNVATSAKPLATEKSKKSIKTPATVKKQSRTAKSATKADLKFSLDAGDIEMEACLFTMDMNKGIRAKQYRPKPGGFEAPSKETRLQTKNMLLGIVSPALLQLMFSNDFQDHVAAAEMITEGLPNFLQEVISALDLILSWAIMILCEANTQSSVKVLSMLKEFLSSLRNEGYHLSEMEASILLPGVIEKSGSNQDYIRSSYREVLRSSTRVFNATRVLDYVVQGLGSKNSRTKVECCDTLSWLVDNEPPECVLSSKQKPVLALANVCINFF